MTTRRGRIALAVLGAGAVALLVAELALGALHFGSTKLADPCTAKPAFSGGGIDGAIQRFALAGLNGAACKLGTDPRGARALVLAGLRREDPAGAGRRSTRRSARASTAPRARAPAAASMGSAHRLPAARARRPARRVVPRRRLSAERARAPRRAGPSRYRQPSPGLLGVRLLVVFVTRDHDHADVRVEHDRRADRADDRPVVDVEAAVLNLEVRVLRRSAR